MQPHRFRTSVHTPPPRRKHIRIHRKLFPPEGRPFDPTSKRRLCGVAYFIAPRRWIEFKSGTCRCLAHSAAITQKPVCLSDIFIGALFGRLLAHSAVSRIIRQRLPREEPLPVLHRTLAIFGYRFDTIYSLRQPPKAYRDNRTTT